MNQQTTEMSFQLLIEEDKVQGDFIGYIPAVRLGVQGESLEEVRANAADLLQMEIESRLQLGKSLRLTIRRRWSALRSASNADAPGLVSDEWIEESLLAKAGWQRHHQLPLPQ